MCFQLFFIKLDSHLDMNFQTYQINHYFLKYFYLKSRISYVIFLIILKRHIFLIFFLRSIYSVTPI